MQYHLYVSSKPEKKYMVKFMNPGSKKINTVHFGASGYTDYTISKDVSQKERYVVRHRRDNIDDPNYAGFYAMNLLWNKRTLQASINDTNRRYSIKIINHT